MNPKHVDRLVQQCCLRGFSKQMLESVLYRFAVETTARAGHEFAGGVKGARKAFQKNNAEMYDQITIAVRQCGLGDEGRIEETPKGDHHAAMQRYMYRKYLYIGHPHDDMKRVFKKEQNPLPFVLQAPSWHSEDPEEYKGMEEDKRFEEMDAIAFGRNQPKEWYGEFAEGSIIELYNESERMGDFDF